MWIIPSRGRPDQLFRFVQAYFQTDASTPLIVQFDEDDPKLMRYNTKVFPPQWSFRVRPRKATNFILNDIFKEFPNESFYGPLADDVVPKTPHWDTKLISLAGSDGVAYGDDGIGGQRLATHACLGGNFVRDNGFITLPGLARLHGDDVWHTIAEKRGVLRYMGNVKMLHYHFSNGLAERDETYRKPEALDDHRLYQEWQANYK
jgi:hypothetical protein